MPAPRRFCWVGGRHSSARSGSYFPRDSGPAHSWGFTGVSATLPIGSLRGSPRQRRGQVKVQAGTGEGRRATGRGWGGSGSDGGAGATPGRGVPLPAGAGGAPSRRNSGAAQSPGQLLGGTGASRELPRSFQEWEAGDDSDGLWPSSAAFRRLPGRERGLKTARRHDRQPKRPARRRLGEARLADAWGPRTRGWNSLTGRARGRAGKESCAGGAERTGGSRLVTNASPPTPPPPPPAVTCPLGAGPEADSPPPTPEGH